MSVGSLIWSNLRLGRLGWNTLFGTGGLGARALIQACYLLVLSRWLGASGFGLFAGSVALVVLVAPLANWGSPLLLTRYVTRDRTTSRAMWATALSQTAVVGSVLVVFLLFLAGFILQERVSLGAMLLLAASELLLLPAAQAATSHCFALERGFTGGMSICVVPLGRLMAALAVLAGGSAGTPEHAAAAHFLGSLAGLMAALGLVARVDGWPAWSKRLPISRAMGEGTQYALGGLVGTSYQEIDKIMMLQLLGAAVVGPYTAGFRIASVFVMPVAALIGATLPRLMTLQGTPGKAQTYRAVVIAATGYGFVASLGTLAIAPLLSGLFGAGYEATGHLALLLAPWPLAYALHQCMAIALTASGRQGARVLIEGTGFMLVGALNLFLLRQVGAAASVYALLTTEVLIAIACWFVMRKDKP